MSLIIAKTFKLDFTRKAPLEYIFVKTGDKNSRILDITPLNSGAPYVIPKGVKATFAATKADGKEIFDTADITSGGHIQITLSEQTLALTGVTSCEVCLYDESGALLTSQHFYMKADEHLVENATSSDEYQALVVALLAADKKVQEIEELQEEVRQLNKDIEDNQESQMLINQANTDQHKIMSEQIYNLNPCSKGLNIVGISTGGYAVRDIGECKDSDIIIPASVNGVPITVIGYGAFAECEQITSVTIPDSVTGIGLSAFSGCNSLKKVKFLAKVPMSTIDISAFPSTVEEYLVPYEALNAYKKHTNLKAIDYKVKAYESLEKHRAEIDAETAARGAADRELQKHINAVSDKVGLVGTLSAADFVITGVTLATNNYAEVQLIMIHENNHKIMSASLFYWGCDLNNIVVTDGVSFAIPAVISGSNITIRLSQITLMGGYTYAGVGRIFIKSYA